MTGLIRYEQAFPIRQDPEGDVFHALAEYKKGFDPHLATEKVLQQAVDEERIAILGAICVHVMGAGGNIVTVLKPGNEQMFKALARRCLPAIVDDITGKRAHGFIYGGGGLRETSEVAEEAIQLVRNAARMKVSRVYDKYGMPGLLKLAKMGIPPAISALANLHYEYNQTAGYARY